MQLSGSAVKEVLQTTVREIGEDDVPSLAAAIAYYAVFSLPPLLVLLVAIAGAILGPDRVAEMLAGQAESAIGPSGAEAIRTMIENASTTGSGLGAKLLGIAALLFGATGAFGQLQKALNRAWEVEGQSEGGGLVALVTKRVLSFGMVLTIAFLLLVSLAVSAALAALGGAVAGAAGEGAMGVLAEVANVVVSLGVSVALFAVLFKVLPDAQIAWRDTLVGAAVTAVLFTLGKSAIAVYLGTASPGSAFGAAGSLALLLVWIYYSSLIVLVGAEFTQAWAERFGAGIEPEAHGPPGAGAKAGGAKAGGSDAPKVTVGGADSEVHPLAKPRDPAPY